MPGDAMFTSWHAKMHISVSPPHTDPEGVSVGTISCCMLTVVDIRGAGTPIWLDLDHALAPAARAHSTASASSDRDFSEETRREYHPAVSAGCSGF